MKNSIDLLSWNELGEAIGNFNGVKRASCEQATPSADLEGGQELLEKTSSFLHRCLASWSGRRKPPSLLDVGLSTSKNLSHLSNIVLQEILVQGVTNL